MKKDKKTHKHLSPQNLIFLLILLLWALLSFFSLFYNGAKAISDGRQWIPLAESQKKYIIFGDMYSFFVFVQDNTPKNARIILYPHTEEMFYRGIYELYPRIAATAKNYSELNNLAQTGKYDYIATFNVAVNIDNFQQIASLSGKQQNFGIVYKRK